MVRNRKPTQIASDTPSPNTSQNSSLVVSVKSETSGLPALDSTSDTTGGATGTLEAKQIFPTPDLPLDSLNQITKDLDGCVRCKLCQKRKSIVVGEGNPTAELVFVGEGPGEQEDLQGRPFVGKAGQLLDKMIEAMGLRRDQVYIVNVVKCRPPGNRNPELDEIEACSQFLFRQLDVIRPKVVVALGKFAAQTLLNTTERITQIRGKFFSYRGTKLMPTFHPAYLLRNPSSKREAWSDLQLVAHELGIEIPSLKTPKSVTRIVPRELHPQRPQP